MNNRENKRLELLCILACAAGTGIMLGTVGYLTTQGYTVVDAAMVTTVIAAYFIKENSPAIIGFVSGAAITKLVCDHLNKETQQNRLA